jgi:hypothetical protein
MTEEGFRVPAGDEMEGRTVGCDHLMRAGDGRQAAGTFVGELAQFAAAEPERGLADADDVVLDVSQLKERSLSRRIFDDLP